MMRRALLAACLAVAGLALAGAAARAHADLATPVAPAYVPGESCSRMALPMWRPGEKSQGLLAQRTIERDWGPSDDSLYKVVDVPGWKSEGLALLSSAAVPGAGQLYTGESSGWLFLVTEAAGWTGRLFSKRKSDRYDEQAARYIGVPTDSSSNWSFERWVTSTGGDPSTLERLYAGDREAFYRAIATDPQYLSGYRTRHPEQVFSAYRDLRDLRDQTLHRTWLIESALWFNHLVAAIDAFRAARSHNLPLRQQYELKLGQRWSHGQPEFRAALVRRF
jgi:hypothetical protein